MATAVQLPLQITYRDKCREPEPVVLITVTAVSLLAGTCAW